MSQAKLLDYPIFTKNLGNDYYEENSQSNATTQYKRDVFGQNKFFSGSSHIYTIGTYNGNTDISSLEQTPSTIKGCLIKTDYTGNVIWAKTIGNNTHTTFIYQIDVIESSLNEYQGIYICGKYTSALSTEYNNIILRNTNNIQSGFVAKYTLDGEFVESYVLQPNGSGTQTTCISVSSKGIFFGSMIKRTNALFKITSAGEENILSNIFGRGMSSTFFDMCIIGINSSTIVFNKIIASSAGNNFIRDITLIDNELYVLFEFYRTSSLLLDTYLDRYIYSVENSQWNITEEWRKKISANNNDYGNCLLVTNTSVLIGGSLSVSLGQAFGNETDSDLLTYFSGMSATYSSGSTQGYIISRKRDNTGSLEWAKIFTMTNLLTEVGKDESIVSICSANNNIYAIGEIREAYEGNVLSELNGDLSLNSLLTFNFAASGTSGFILKYDTSGNYIKGQIIDNQFNDKLYCIMARSNYIGLYSSKLINTNLITNFTVYNDLDELPISLIPSNGNNLGEVKLIITNINADPYQLLINDTLQIDLSGIESTYYHISATNNVNNYKVFKNEELQYEKTFRPKELLISGIQGETLATTKLQIISHSENDFNSVYSVYRFTTTNTTPIKLEEDISNLTYIDVIDEDISYNYYIIATTQGGMDYQSNTVNIVPQLPSLSLSQSTTSLGLVLITVNNFNSVYKLYRYHENNIEPELIYTGTDNEYIDAFVNTSLHTYYIVVENVYGNVNYTSAEQTITPKKQIINVNNGSILGSIILTVDSYNTTYNIYRTYKSQKKLLNINISSQTYVDFLAEDGLNTYYIESIVGNVIYKSNELSITPTPLNIKAYKKNIISYDYICERYYNSYTLWDADNNKQIDTFATNIFTIFSKPINFYVTSMTNGGIVFKSNTINLVEGYATLFPIKRDTFNIYGINSNSISTNKKIYMSESYIYSCGTYRSAANTMGLPFTSVLNGFISISDYSGNIINKINIGNSTYATFINQIDIREDISSIFICGNYQKNNSTNFTNILLPNTSDIGDPPIAGFVAKYDLSLNYIWSVAIKGSSQNISTALSIGNDELFIASNSIISSLTIESPNEILYSFANLGNATNIILYKLSLNGEWINHTPLIIEPQGNENNSITDIVYSDNILYAVYQLSTISSSLDTYTVALNPSDFSEIWSKSIISSGTDVGLCLSVNNQSVFVAGYCNGIVAAENDTFDILNAGISNISFIVKRNKINGILEWTKRFNSLDNFNGFETLNTSELIYSVYATDNDLYVIGYSSNYLYEWYALFGTLESRKLITTELNFNSIFILKYNVNGDLIYSTQYDTNDNDIAYNICKKNNYLSLIFRGESGQTTYALYKEEEPVKIITRDGNVLGVIDIGLTSSYNFTYKLFANNSTSFITIPNNYSYLEANDGNNTFYLQCIASDKSIITYTFNFIPRKIDISLSNPVKGKIELVPTLYGAYSYIIERSLNNILFGTRYANATTTYIDNNITPNALYYYRIKATSPYSGIIFTSQVKSILASETLSINPPNQINIAVNTYNDNRTHGAIIPNKKIMIANNSVYGIGNYTNASLLFSNIGIISNPQTLYGFLIKTDYNGNPLEGFSIGNDISNTTLHQLNVVEFNDHEGVYICGSYASNSNAIYTNIKLIDSVNRAGFIAKYNLKNEFQWAYCIISDVDAEITSFVVSSRGVYFGASIKGTNSIYKVDLNNNISIIESNIIATSSLSSRIITRHINLSTIDSQFSLSFSSPLNVVSDNYIRDIRTSTDGIYLICDVNEGGINTPNEMNTLWQKYTYMGELIWSKKVASNGSDYGYAIVETNTGIVAAGSQSFDFTNRIVFELDLLPLFTVNIQNGTAYLISRTKDSSGNLQWAKQINLVQPNNANYSAQEPIYSIATINNSLYVCGQLLVTPNIKTLKINESTYIPGLPIVTQSLITFSEDTSGTVGFIIKYSIDGQFKWIKIIDNPGNDMLTSIYAFNGHFALMNIINVENQSTNNLIIFRDNDEFFYNYDISEQYLVVPPTDTNPTAIPCIVKGARIKTTDGEILIENLTTAHIIVDSIKRKIPIKAIYKTKMIVTEKTAPYKIPKGTFGILPIHDLYLSPKHAFQSSTGIWQIPEFSKHRKIKKAMIGQEVQYYHIELPNYYTDNLIANGMVIESFAAKQIDLTSCVYKYSKQKNGFLRKELALNAIESPKSH
jgi:hypothetical protein